MSKTISKQDWDTLRYPISLRQLSMEEGGGWLAAIPMLGQAAFTADGETAEEALQELEALRRDLYEDVIASGQPLPLPQDVTDERKWPSGKWIMRTSARFHAELQEAAKSSGLSFNAYCNHALERGHAAASMYHAAQEAVQAMTEEIAIQVTKIISVGPGRKMPSERRGAQTVFYDIAPGYSPSVSQTSSQNSYGFNTTFNTRGVAPDNDQKPKPTGLSVGG